MAGTPGKVTDIFVPVNSWCELNGEVASMNPRFEDGITDFLNKLILFYVPNFHIVGLHRKADYIGIRSCYP